MQIQTIFLFILAAVTAVQAAVNEPCYGDGGAAAIQLKETVVGLVTVMGLPCQTNAQVPVGSNAVNQKYAPGTGGYKAPSFPAVGACKAVSVNGAKKIVDAFPGRIREIGCTRACECGGNNSDHCCGKATDMMCSDAGGTPTISGKEIAEWVMNHRQALNLKYVIWGQKIWDSGRDSVQPWSSWRTMEDRGSITENHWDHVHVSYN